MVNVTLSERGRAIVEQQLESGGYEDAAQVVERALTLLQEGAEAYWADVNRKIDEGLSDLAAGRVVPWTPGLREEIKRRGRDLAAKQS